MRTEKRGGLTQEQLDVQLESLDEKLSDRMAESVAALGELLKDYARRQIALADRVKALER